MRYERGISRSEADMKQKAIDPVCGMEISREAAFASKDYEGKTYYFCAPSCLEKFEKSPQTYADRSKKR